MVATSNGNILTFGVRPAKIEFEVCYVTHGPRASNNLKGNETRFVTYSTRLENEVSKIFIIS